MSEVVYVIRLKKDKDHSFRESKKSRTNSRNEYEISRHGNPTTHQNVILPSEQRYGIHQVIMFRAYVCIRYYYI